MPKQFEFCRVCRRNQDQGRGHRYSLKHKQCLDSLLGKIHRQIEDVRQFLKNVSPVTDEVQVRSEFWCHFCEQEISEQKSLFIRAQAIEHLGSQKHAENVKGFLAENGGKLEKLHMYVIESTELAGWEEACKVVPPWERVHGQTPSRMKNDVQSNQKAVDVSLIEDQKKSSVSEATSSVAGLTVILVPGLKPGEGNVHSGAAPPWLKQTAGNGDKLPTSPASLSSHLLPLSRTQERKLAKMRNPNRVGAAWAEVRRAELEREQRGEIVEKSVKDVSSWFPSFGRVWQSGSRRDSRKEFEAEKHSELQKHQRRGKGLGKNKITSRRVELQPYVSRRQRMAMDCKHE